MKFISTAGAPTPAGHYSQAVVHGGLVFVAGQLPIDPSDPSRAPGTIEEQTELALGSPPFETPLVPFGVFLAPAALLTLFWGDALLGWIARV